MREDGMLLSKRRTLGPASPPGGNNCTPAPPPVRHPKAAPSCVPVCQ
eukprot:gene10748-9423_t